MTLDYSKEIFNKFKTLSVKSIDEIAIGQTYYGTSCREFVVKELVTWQRMWILSGEPTIAESACDDKIAWIRTEDDRFISLSDNNIGASYNPWMLFKNKKDREDCKNNLTVKYIPDGDDYLDGWFDDY